MTSQKNNIRHATLIFVRGLPGSGKSYLATRLVKEFKKDDAVLLDPDLIDTSSNEYQLHTKQQAAEGVDPKLYTYRFSRAKAFTAIEAGKTVIWNQPFNDLEVFNKVTDRFKDFVTKNKLNLQVVVVEVDIDPEIAKRRVETRKANGGHGPSPDIFQRFVGKFISFKGQGYEIITVDGEAKVEESIQKILSNL